LDSSSRRVFLQMLGIGGALGCAAGCSSSPASAEAFGDVTAGNVAAVPVGTLRAVSGAPAILGRDASGLYAMTSTCTHQACDMIQDGSISSSGVVCDCHGSHFDVNGNPTAGPASAPLEHFEVTVDASGAITVHGGSSVSEATRLAVTA
jgi:nitrite reductase/ring-hydroxylating ferredoxin subunit